MSVQVKRRRDTAANLAGFIGAQAELLIDTTNNRVQVHDGATAGGWPAAKLAEVLTNRRTAVADANYSVLTIDRTIAFTSLSAARSVALPLADAFPTGTALLVLDESGACSATNTITLARAGSDTIDGAASATITSAHGYIALQSDGASKWTVIGQPTSVSGATRTAISDAAYTIVASDRLVAYTALTASRTLTLCAASAYPAGTILWIVDESGACSASDAINVNRAGSDTIDGTTSTVLNAAYMALGLESNGANTWTIIGQVPNVAANLVGIGTAPDPTNPLSVHAANALFSSASDFRIKLNKASSSNTASFLFQDGFSGRAEIGLTGDDNFHFKVSPDGSAWHDSLDIAAASGLVTANFGMALAGATSGMTQIQAAASASGTLTLPAATDTLVARATADTLTNKTIDASANSMSNLTTAMFASSIVDTDGTLTADSDTRLASQKAVKTYVDAHAGNSALSSAALEVVAASDVAAVFVYDTTRDSDGGAWRRKVAGTSWMTETLNTSTRGSRQEFPSKALVIGLNAGSGAPGIIIYDLDDPTCPMWMVFTGSSSTIIALGAFYPITSITAKNGRLLIGQQNGGGCQSIGFILDKLTSFQSGGQIEFFGGIVDRNTPVGDGNVGTGIVSSTVNSVAVNVSPLTPKNLLRCGLPNQVICVGTAGGASIIRADGVIVSSASTTAVISCCFDKPLDPKQAPNLWTLTSAALNISNAYLAASWDVAALGTFSTANLNIGTLVSVTPIRGGVAVSGSTGMVEILLDQTVPANSLIGKVTAAFNTGFMANAGAAVLALAESTAVLGNLTSGSPPADRSPAAQTMTVSGTITRSAVASGSELAAYGGFSSSNKLSAPNILNGATDCYGAGWVNTGGSYLSTIFEWSDTARTGDCLNLFYTGTLLYTYPARGGGSYPLNFPVTLPSASYVFCAAVIRGTRLELYLNGKLVASTSISSTAFSNSSAITAIGTLADGTYNQENGVALVRIGKFAPTPDQIAAMYAAELPLFQPGAKCLLHGSGSVQALAFDPDQNQVAVSQSSGGTDVFEGLQNLSTQLSTAPLSGSNNHKAAAFSDSDLVIGTAAGVDAILSTIALRENLTKRLPRKPYDPEHATFRGVTTNATPTIIGSFVIPEGKAYGLIVKAFGISYAGAMVERVDYIIEGGVQRPIGGNVNVDAATRTIFEVTGSQDCSAATDTTNQLCTIVATGKASTIEQWVATVELADIGLEPAA